MSDRRDPHMGKRPPYSCGLAPPMGSGLRVNSSHQGEPQVRRATLVCRTGVRAAPPVTAALPAALTARPASVLRLMAAGHANADIARLPDCSEHTVKNVVHEVMVRSGPARSPARYAAAWCDARDDAGAGEGRQRPLASPRAVPAAYRVRTGAQAATAVRSVPPLPRRPRGRPRERPRRAVPPRPRPVRRPGRPGPPRRRCGGPCGRRPRGPAGGSAGAGPGRSPGSLLRDPGGPAADR